MRGWPCSYMIQSEPSGLPLSSIQWSYSWHDGSNTYQDSTIWSGRMVVDGTLVVTAMVGDEWCVASMVVTITPRNWTISVSCAQDNDPDYGDIPKQWTDLGSNRDRDSNFVAYVFVPRSAGFDFSPARTLAQVPSGPCAGWWYVSSTSLKCNRETVINRYIKPDGPMLGSTNFFGANADCFSTSPSHFLQAAMNHEYRGTPDTPMSPGGHQGRTEMAIFLNGNDPKQKIESLTRRDPGSLSMMVNTAISNAETSVLYLATDETYMQTWGPNWGGPDGLGVGLHAVWNDFYYAWTACVYRPDTF